jgi:anion-transporting  ArsA/GET3 family ATPase
MTAAPTDLLDRRLIIVTGKGGVGKTAIACAVAEAGRQAGRRVLLVETSPIEAIAARFESKARPLGYAGRELRPGLRAMRIDPHEALAEYVRLQTHLGLITDRILQAQTFRELLDAAPGWRELIVLGKIWHLEQKKQDRGERPLYDLIVVDAPATGHGLAFLDVPRVVQQAIRAGPLTRHASWVEAMVHDPKRTLLLPVTLPEELPVSETIELVERARDEIGIPVDRIVVNRFPGAPPDGLAEALADLPDALGLERLPEPPSMRALAEHAAIRASIARAERARVAQGCDLPVVEMPVLPEGFGPDLAWVDQVGHVLETPFRPDRSDAGADAA